ncbi:hypothetical protein [Spiroplasma sp. Moj]|uniref:hypothetical protein n=1 Tax=Spiroplasma sp. Moj TaxID=1922342 RepID=UPI0039EF734E
MRLLKQWIIFQFSQNYQWFKEFAQKKEIKIANYICENIHNIRNLKIEDLSKATGIGYSPIYSLIKKLGFIGYRDFIIAVVAEQERLETNNLHLDETESIFLYYQDMLERN